MKMSNANITSGDVWPVPAGLWSDVCGLEWQRYNNIDRFCGSILLPRGTIMSIDEASKLIELGEKYKKEDEIRSKNSCLTQLWQEYQTLLALVKDEG